MKMEAKKSVAFMRSVYIAVCRHHENHQSSIQDDMYSAFYDTIVAKQLHRKLSF